MCWPGHTVNCMPAIMVRGFFCEHFCFGACVLCESEVAETHELTSLCPTCASALSARTREWDTSVTELMNESGAIINDAVGLGDELTAIDKVPAAPPCPWTLSLTLCTARLVSQDSFPTALFVPVRKRMRDRWPGAGRSTCTSFDGGDASCVSMLHVSRRCFICLDAFGCYMCLDAFGCYMCLDVFGCFVCLPAFPPPDLLTLLPCVLLTFCGINFWVGT